MNVSYSIVLVPLAMIYGLGLLRYLQVNYKPCSELLSLVVYDNR